jgi:hypothetical protein
MAQQYRNSPDVTRRREQTPFEQAFSVVKQANHTTHKSVLTCSTTRYHSAASSVSCDTAQQHSSTAGVAVIAQAAAHLHEAAGAHAEHRLRGEQLPVHVLPADRRARQVAAVHRWGSGVTLERTGNRGHPNSAIYLDSAHNPVE